MRGVAVEADVRRGFSIGGSLEVVAFGALLGAPVALAFWAARRRWRLPRGAGTAVGLLLLAVLSIFQPPAASSALGATPDSPLATGLLFTAAFGSYGLLLDLLWRWRMPGPT
jgi:hypothetical protein